jgi:phosphoribosyl 1,2-cyclic phosphate phosphodiesterase
MSKTITFLGTGTSSGIPTIGCPCPVCNSDNPKDKRLRASILIQSETTSILIDTSTDFRQQMLLHNIKKIDAVFYTHQHFDHIGGFDDIRAFNYSTRRPIQIYGLEKTMNSIKRTFFYAFGDLEQLGGGVPMVDVHLISDEPVKIGDIEIIPIPLLHGNMEILGFRIDDFAYCTDTNHIPDKSMNLLQNLDVLVLGALRYNRHETHFTIDEAIQTSKQLNPKATYFTHMAHQIMHDECEEYLPENIHLAYDGLVLNI